MIQEQGNAKFCISRCPRAGVMSYLVLVHSSSGTVRVFSPEVSAEWNYPGYPAPEQVYPRHKTGKTTGIEAGLLSHVWRRLRGVEVVEAAPKHAPYGPACDISLALSSGPLLVGGLARPMRRQPVGPSLDLSSRGQI